MQTQFSGHAGIGTMPHASTLHGCPRVTRTGPLSRSYPRPVLCAASSGSTVGKNTLLVVGGTGTLGRQVVRQALDEGYEVRCTVRPRQTPADFLRDWGATTVQADLTDPTSLPAALVGIHSVIDCATARPEESTMAMDWESKVALIQCAQAMSIQRYVFCSIVHCDRHPEVPLMNIKNATEKFLQQSGVDYTILRLCGFMQALVASYAIPVLEDRAVWGTKDDTRTAYMDTQDIARLVLASLRTPEAVNKTLDIAGPQAYTTQEIIGICERLADTDAKTRNIPVWLLKGTRSILRSLQWAGDAADRLAFAEVLAGNENFSAPMHDTYRLLGVEPGSVTTVEAYLKDYFTSISKKLKEVGGGSSRQDFYV
ncbi:HCF244 [Auxenochlorella protothecoides x Auxenochlorella symbiontica]